MDEDLALDGLELPALRERWRVRFGAPPTIRSPELMALILAYRLQAARHGGLEVEVRRALRRPAKVAPLPALTPGTRLVREWQGVRHEVVANPDGGFVHQGATYRSLSQVARAITGVRWNGPRFFGLRAGEGGA